MLTPRINNAVLAAFEHLIAVARHSATFAPARSDDEKFFRAEANAYERAKAMFEAGIAPEQLAGGSWRVTSADRKQTYITTNSGTCTCQAGQNGTHCKHLALVTAYETGLEDLNTYDDYDPELDYVDAVRNLFERIAEMRARYLLEVA